MKKITYYILKFLVSFLMYFSFYFAIAFLILFLIDIELLDLIFSCLFSSLGFVFLSIYSDFENGRYDRLFDK